MHESPVFIFHNAVHVPFSQYLVESTDGAI
jgi:hypothetical protein